MTKHDRIRIYECELYKLLLNKLPPDYIRGKGYLNVKLMSEVSGFSQFSILRWLRGTHFTKKSINALIHISNVTEFPSKKGLLTVEELIPFLIND